MPPGPVAQNAWENADITNLETLALSLGAELDPHHAGSDEVMDNQYEIPSVMITNMRGINHSDGGDELRYRACPSCNFKKLTEDGSCEKCGGTDSVERYMLLVTIADPTGSVEGIMYHEAATELLQNDDTPLKPLVAVAHVGPD